MQYSGILTKIIRWNRFINASSMYVFGFKIQSLVLIWWLWQCVWVAPFCLFYLNESNSLAPIQRFNEQWRRENTNTTDIWMSSLQTQLKSSHSKITTSNGIIDVKSSKSQPTNMQKHLGSDTKNDLSWNQPVRVFFTFCCCCCCLNGIKFHIIISSLSIENGSRITIVNKPPQFDFVHGIM